MNYIAGPHHPRSLISCNRFRFLNREAEIRNADDWNSDKHEKLWLYNLHYFNDLNAEDWEHRKQWHYKLINRWIEENPPTSGNGWEPYPTSLRIVNWIKWVLNGNNIDEIAIHSLAIQVRWLRKRLEYHLLGNHLFANAKALVFGGLFFEGKEAGEWFRKGLSILDCEIEEQILNDGGHIERSPMYHAIILEDMLDLLNIYQCYGLNPNKKWKDKIQEMRKWLCVMTHPNGELSFFNDVALNVAASRQSLENYAVRLGLAKLSGKTDSVCDLVESGYVRVLTGKAKAIFDVAPVGPDYLPAHAHADTLSFELSINKQRVLVNSGTSEYGVGRERLRQRGTTSHNTIAIDNENSSEVWSGFRVGRRAKLIRKKVQKNAQGEVIVSAAHDGYRFLAGSPVHRRTWEIFKTQMIIKDEIEGQGVHRLQLLYHVHPDCRVVRKGSSEFIISDYANNILCVILIYTENKVEVLDSTYHPEFGIVKNNKVLWHEWQEVLPEKCITKIVWD